VEWTALLGPSVVGRLQEAGRLAAALGGEVWLVGGTVRDLLLGRSPTDIDLVTTCGGIALAEELAQAWGGRVVAFGEFDTAKVILSEGAFCDVAGCRSEDYPQPAVLPRVRPAGDLLTDLSRRDFTINALAIALHPCRWGQLVDPFGGRSDLEDGLIRCLYDRSFIDDPTRLFRALRFAHRFDYRIHQGTGQLMVQAIEGGYVGRLSDARLGAEVEKLLGEADPPRVLQRLAHWGLLQAIHHTWSAPGPELAAYAQICRDLGRGCGGQVLQPEGFLYLAGSLHHLPEEEVRIIARRLALSARRQEKLVLIAANWERICAGLAQPLPPSGIYNYLVGLPVEILVIVASKTESPLVRKGIKAFWQELACVEITLTGNDLLQMGYQRGPSIGRALERILQDKLDGLVQDRAAELALARELLIEEGF
jgi:tRNA nucleotidyltransferase (CCA-adding enzyme)